MNNKILSAVLVLWIASTWFAWISAASSGNLKGTLRWKSEIREIYNKLESWESLSAEEQALLDEAKAVLWDRAMKKGFDGFGKRSWFNNLTSEEIASLESMTDAEKQTFFAAKKEAMIAQKEAHKLVIDKLIAGESLTAAEEATRLEILAKFENNDMNHPMSKKRWDIIAKLVAWDELTPDEKTQLETMQSQNAQREAQRERFEAIKMKLGAGEILTSEEQATLDSLPKKEGKFWNKGRKIGHMWFEEEMDNDMEQDDTSELESIQTN